MFNSSFCIFLFSSIFTTLLAQNFTYSSTFSINALTSGFPTSDGTPWNDQDAYPILMGDVNGDGKADLIGFGINGVYVSLSSSTGFGSPSLWTVSFSHSSWTSFDLYPRFMGDINGDGKADIVGYNSGNVYVGISTGISFSLEVSWSTLYTTSAGYTSFNTYIKTGGDFDGDGKADLIVFKDYVRKALSSGLSFGSDQTTVAEFVTTTGWTNYSTYPRFVGDLNGDGKADVLGLQTGARVGFSNGTYLVNLSTWYTGFTNDHAWTNQSSMPRFLADLNGDGKADLIGFNSSGVYGQFSTGSNFGPATSWVNFSSSGAFLRNDISYKQIADVNGDGKADIVAFTNNGSGIRVFLSNSLVTITDRGLYCSLCSPTDYACSSCFTSPVYFINGVASCPPGTNLTQPSTCTSLSPYIIMTTAQDCTNLYVNVTLRQSEMDYYKAFFIFWQISGNFTNSAMFNTLYSDVTQQTSFILQIPLVYLEPYVNYTVRFSYLNALRVNMTNTTSFSIGSANQIYPIFSTPSTNASITARDLANTLSIDLGTTQCTGLSNNMVYSWVQTGGPSINFNSLLIQNNQLQFPSCLLPQNVTYYFKASAYLSGYSQFNSSKTFKVTVGLDSIGARIDFGDRSQPYNKPINVTGVFFYNSLCTDQDMSGFGYDWTCAYDPHSTGAFSNCSDPNSIFGMKSTPGLLVPQTYFNQSATVTIGLVISKDVRTAQVSSNFYISNGNTLIIQLACEYPPCIKYNSDKDLYLKAVIQNDPGSGYVLSWTINYPLPIVQYQNVLYMNGDTSSYGGATLTFTVRVLSNKYSGSATFNLPMNIPPENGTLTVFPPSGTSFTTNFLISADNWEDTDLPLSYAFYYSILDLTLPLTAFQSNSYTYTYLPGNQGGTEITIMTDIQDALGAVTRTNTTTIVTSTSQSLTQALGNMGSVLSSLSTDPTSLVQASNIATELQNYQNNLLDLRQNIISCSGCGSQTTCLYGTCTCRDTGNGTIDCSITQNMVTQATDMNTKLLQLMSVIYSNLTNLTSSESTFYVNSILTTLKSITSNPDFNNDTTNQQTLNFLENNLDVLNPNKVLTKDQATTVSDIASNVLSSTGQQDCNCNSSFCSGLENTTSAIFDKMSSDLLKDSIPGQDPTKISTSTFDLVAYKTTKCQLGNTTLGTTSNSPSVTISPIDQTDCGEVVDVSYYSMLNNSELFNCGSPNSNTKNIIIIKIVDSSTQQNIANNFTLRAQMPPGTGCPPGCAEQQDLSCQCNKMDLFDVKGQMDLIFKASSISSLQNYQAISNWTWMNSPIFWVNSGMLGTTVASMFIFRAIPSLNNYCVISNLGLENISGLKAILLAFLVQDDILNMYFVNRSEYSKLKRMMLYYVRMILYSTFSALFSSAGINDGLLNLIVNMQLYVIALPYITILPLNLLLSKLITRKSDLTKNSKIAKLLDLISALILLSLVGGCIFIMFIIAANKSNEAQQSWMFYFFVTLIQDVLVFPLLLTVVQRVVYNTLRLYPDSSNTLCKKILTGLEDENCKYVFMKVPISNSPTKIYPETLNSNPTRREPNTYHTEEQEIKPRLKLNMDDVIVEDEIEITEIKKGKVTREPSSHRSGTSTTIVSPVEHPQHHALTVVDIDKRVKRITKMMKTMKIKNSPLLKIP